MTRWFFGLALLTGLASAAAAQYPGGYGQGGYGQGGYGQGGGYGPGGPGQGGYGQGGYGPGGYGPGYGPQGPQQRPRRVWIPVVITVVALLVLGSVVGGVALLAGGSTSPPTPTAAPPSSSLAPTTSSSPPTTSTTPASSYTASSMFGSGNGSCRPLTSLNTNETNGILCNRGGPVDAFFVQYTGTAQAYADSLRGTLSTMEKLNEDDCRIFYKGTNTPDDGKPRHQLIIIYKNSNFSGTWIGVQKQTTFQQLIDEPARAADEGTLCGR